MRSNSIINENVLVCKIKKISDEEINKALKNIKVDIEISLNEISQLRDRINFLQTEINLIK